MEGPDFGQQTHRKNERLRYLKTFQSTLGRKVGYLYLTFFLLINVSINLIFFLETFKLSNIPLPSTTVKNWGELHRANNPVVTDDKDLLVNLYLAD